MNTEKFVALPPAIGDRVDFTDHEGNPLSGDIVGRDWAFENLLAYTVRTMDGKRYHVNARDLSAGHPF